MPRQRSASPQFLDPSPDLHSETVVLDSDDEESPEWRPSKRARIEYLPSHSPARHSWTILSASLKGPFDSNWKNPWAEPMNGAFDGSSVSNHMSRVSEHEGIRTREHTPEKDCRSQTRISFGSSVSEKTELAKDHLCRGSDKSRQTMAGGKASKSVPCTMKVAAKSSVDIELPQSLFQAQPPQTEDSPVSECSFLDYLAADHPERSKGRSPTIFQGFSFIDGSASSTPTITTPAEIKRLEGTALKHWNETQPMDEKRVPPAVTTYQSLLGCGEEMYPSNLQESRSSEWPKSQVAPKSSTAENKSSPVEAVQTHRSCKLHSKFGSTLANSGHPRVIRPMNTLHQQLPATASHISKESNKRPGSAPGLGEWPHKDAVEKSDIYDLPMSPSNHLLDGRQDRPSRSEARNSNPELRLTQKNGKAKAGVQLAVPEKGLPISALVEGHGEGLKNGQRSRSCAFATKLHLHPKSLKSRRDSRISALNCRLHRNTQITTGQCVQEDPVLPVPVSRVTQLAANECHMQKGVDSGGPVSWSSDKTLFKDLAEDACTEELAAKSVRALHRTSAGTTKSAMDGTILAVTEDLETVVPPSALLHLDGIRARVPYQCRAELDADIKELSGFLDGWDMEAELRADGEHIAPSSGVPIMKP